MKKNNVTAIAIFLMISVVFSAGCVIEQSALKIDKSLPDNMLAHYTDPFDTFKEDMWDRAGYASERAQLENFKLADLYIEDGKLIVKTKTGFFSKGGLGSKFTIKGDFDIQVDCKLNFLQGPLKMDQILSFVVIDKTAELQKMDLAVIGLSKIEYFLYNFIYTGYRSKGNYHKNKRKKIIDFYGSLRITRTGNEIKTFYKQKNDIDWNQLGTFEFNKNDVMVGIVLTNFRLERKNITAKAPIQAEFDNFRINAAQEIIEPEI